MYIVQYMYMYTYVPYMFVDMDVDEARGNGNNQQKTQANTNQNGDGPSQTLSTRAWAELNDYDPKLLLNKVIHVLTYMYTLYYLYAVNQKIFTCV